MASPSMSRLAAAVLVGAVLCAVVVSAEVTTNVWSAASSDGNLFSTIVNEEDKVLAARFADQAVRTGIAFSGGGSRSYSATIGQMRALHNLGLLDSSVDFISGVSGGSWASTVLMYTSEADYPLADLLGDSLADPSKLTLDGLLANLPAKHIGNGVVYSSDTTNYEARMPAAAGVDNEWVSMVEAAILDKFGLASSTPTKTFTWNKQTEAEIRSKNPNLPFDFVLAREPPTSSSSAQMPFLIVNACILKESADASAWSPLLPVEFTPLYAGSAPLNFKDSSSGTNTLIGGAFVEPFAFGTSSVVDVTSSSASVALPSTPLSVGMAAGTSSAALALMQEYDPNEVALSFPGFSAPAFSYRTQQQQQQPSQVAKNTLDFGDGGILENTGLVALLRRKVSRCVVFLNTNIAVPAEASSSGTPVLDSEVPALFGVADTEEDTTRVNHAGTAVFEAAEYWKLQQKMVALSAEGKPLVVSTTGLNVQENKILGVSGGWQVDVVWVYLSAPTAYVGALSQDIQGERMLMKPRCAAGSGNSQGCPFPFYSTAMQQVVQRGFAQERIFFNVGQVQLLSSVAEWTLMQNAQLIKATLSKQPASASELNNGDGTNVENPFDENADASPNNSNKDTSGGSSSHGVAVSVGLGLAVVAMVCVVAFAYTRNARSAATSTLSFNQDHEQLLLPDGDTDSAMEASYVMVDDSNV